MNAKALLVFGMLLMGASGLLAQRSISGTVIDANSKEPLIGANILVMGTGEGTVTDLDGKYTLTVPAGYDRLQFSYTGYTSQELVLGASSVVNVQLSPGETLEEVIVIGYGTTRKSDATGSVVAITSKDFIRGNIATPEQLVNGKVAGVQITPNGGAPGSGSRIRIRGGSSLNASNDPLIVIDGVPLDNGGISGAANPLSFINPNDIESFNILKDASATAIYGSRASNGVIIITTKKGTRGDKLNVNFSTLVSAQSPVNSVNVLSGDEFRRAVNAVGTPQQRALLGTFNTDWQQEIFRTAVVSDNNLSLTGNVKGIPFRASGGYLSQPGILKRDQLDRITGSLGISPLLLDDKLKVDINLKATNSKTFFANQGAIGSAVTFDPTQPVRGNEFNGYFEWLDPATRNPNNLAPRNPVAMLETRDDEATANRIIGNVQLDYRFHFLPELRANLNLGLDQSSSAGEIFVPATAAQQFFNGGERSDYTQDKKNQLFEFYLNYAKELPGIKSKFDVLAGYSWQDFTTESTFLRTSESRQDTFANIPFKTQNTLVSFFGRANYSLKDRYLLTFTLRNDGSSRFSPDTRWGLFPSAAFAWRISEENFLRNTGAFSDLKLRLGYGVTGQQDIGSDYPYLARFTPGQPTAAYQFGNTFVNTLRPEGYDERIKWEETVTYNAGLDFGLFGGRLNGSVDYYFKETKDLLAVIDVPAGSNLTNRIFTNIGSIENRGLEIALNSTVIDNRRFSWNAGFNVTFNQNEITKLTAVDDPSFQGIETGGIAGGVGNNIQIHSVGFPRSAFFVNRQVYDGTGKPIEGLYVDENNDGISNIDDRYRYKNPDPTVFLGFTSQFTFDRMSLSFVLRSNLGNYMYNNVDSERGVNRNLTLNNVLRNATPDLLFTGFNNNQYFSDYYIQNASFLRMDNITFGYNVGSILNSKANLQLSAIVQNVFVVTKYTGLDPEIAGGIDNNFYPRPRIFSFGLNLNF